MTRLRLLDNSAWSNLAQPALAGDRADEIDARLLAGELVVSLPFMLEAGYSARSGAEHRKLMDGFAAFPRAHIDDRVEMRARQAQGQLAQVGHHRVPPVDLLIAALADRHDLGVLHYDGDFDLIDRHTDLSVDGEWLAERGSL